MHDLFDRLMLLKRSPMFSMVSTDDLRVVAQALEMQEYFRGDRVFEVNQQGDYLYLLVSGRIGISIEQDPSSREFIATLGPGECFGEMNLLDDLPRSATAQGLEDSTLLALEKGRGSTRLSTWGASDVLTATISETMARGMRNPFAPFLLECQQPNSSDCGA